MALLLQVIVLHFLRTCTHVKVFIFLTLVSVFYRNQYCQGQIYVPFVSSFLYLFVSL